MPVSVCAEASGLTSHYSVRVHMLFTSQRWTPPSSLQPSGCANTPPSEPHQERVGQTQSWSWRWTMLDGWDQSEAVNTCQPICLHFAHTCVFITAIGLARVLHFSPLLCNFPHNLRLTVLSSTLRIVSFSKGPVSQWRQGYEGASVSRMDEVMMS